MNIDLLSKMVRELLLDNDVVTLPGLGSFVAEMVPAVFTDKGFTINPPYRKLYFRENMESENELLVDMYAASNDVSKEVASDVIKEFIGEVKGLLNLRKSVVFSGLGRLRATKENNYFFVPFEDMDIYPEGFGLEPVSLKVHSFSEPEPKLNPIEEVSDEEELPLEESPAGETELISEPEPTQKPEPISEQNPEPAEETPIGEKAVEETSQENGTEEENGENPTGKISIEEQPIGETPIEQTPIEETPIEEGPKSEENTIEETSVDEPNEVTEHKTTGGTPQEIETGKDTVRETIEEMTEEGKPKVEEGSGEEKEKENKGTNEEDKEDKEDKEDNEGNEENMGSEGNMGDEDNEGRGGLSRGWKITLWTIGTIVAVAVILFLLFLLLSRIAPDFINSLLYSKEQLDILNYTGQ